MRTSRLPLLLPAALLAAACSQGASDRAAPPEPPVQESPKLPPGPDAAPACLVRIEADHNKSVLDEQRSIGPHAWDFFTRYASATIDPAGQQVVRTTEAFRVDGQPILWFTADKTAPVVDARAFGALEAVDGTRHTGTPVVIGKATAAARAALPPHDLVRFLIAAGVIRIYAHIGGWVCLTAEAEQAGAWRGQFAGEHEYYTNEHVIAPMRFALELAADGTITFVPGKR